MWEWGGVVSDNDEFLGGVYGRVLGGVGWVVMHICYSLLVRQIKLQFCACPNFGKGKNRVLGK